MCDPILVALLKMRPHDSQSRRDNGTPSSGTFPLASYKELPLREVKKLIDENTEHYKCFKRER